MMEVEVCLNFSVHRASQHQASNTPLPTLGLPPPFRARQSQIQTAPNFDSFVTTVPARLSQAVQTEAIYRCVGDTDTHTMTHTQDPRSARPTSAEPWIQTPGHKRSPDPQRDAQSREAPRPGHRETQRPKKARGHTLRGADFKPDTQTQGEERGDPDRDIQTRTLHRRTEIHSQTETHSATHTPDTHPEPQTPRRPDSVSHARHPPPAPKPKLIKSRPNCSIATAP